MLPPGIPSYQDGADGYTYDPDQACSLLTEAGYLNGGRPRRAELPAAVRGYPPWPPQVASDIRDQLAQVGITVALDQQEDGAFIDNANAGNLGFYMLGWGADFPDATNFWDFHFGEGIAAVRHRFPELHDVLSEAGSTTDEDARNDLYNQANEMLKEHAQAPPIAYGGSAVAFKASVDGAHASPLSNEQFSAMSIEGQDQLVWMQNAELSGLYCADETDGEALRVCEQINESLLPTRWAAPRPSWRWPPTTSPTTT